MRRIYIFCGLEFHHNRLSRFRLTDLFSNFVGTSTTRNGKTLGKYLAIVLEDSKKHANTSKIKQMCVMCLQNVSCLDTPSIASNLLTANVPMLLIFLSTCANSFMLRIF